MDYGTTTYICVECNNSWNNSELEKLQCEDCGCTRVLVRKTTKTNSIKTGNSFVYGMRGS